MTDDPLVRNIHLVAVISHREDPSDRLYAAAVPRGQAVAAVRSRIAPEWTALLTDDHLTASQVAALGIRRGQVKQVVGFDD